MKKKFLKASLAFIMLFMTFVTVNAADYSSAHVITTPAKEMSLAPDKGSTVYAILDDNEFLEFSKNVQFSAANGTDKVALTSGGLPLAAHKIIVSSKPNWTAALSGLTNQLQVAATTLAGESDNWFTAYCLDGTKSFPAYTIYNLDLSTAAGILGLNYNLNATQKTAIESQLTDGQKQMLTELTGDKIRMADVQMGATSLMAIIGKPGIGSSFDDEGGYMVDAQIVYNFFDENGTAAALPYDLTFALSYTHPEMRPSGFGQLGDGLEKLGQLKYGLGQLSNLYGNGEVKILVKEIRYKGVKGDSTVVDKPVTGDQLNALTKSTANVEGYYTLSYTGKDILFDKYSDYDASSYKHSLWIIEHSYPSMTLDAFFTEVGVNKDTLVEQIKGLYPGESFTEAEMNNLLDNFVYNTVQYAIWKANDSAPVGKIGDTLYLGTLETNELNKIYQYLVKDRAEYTTYGTGNYNTKEVIVDTTNKDKVTEKSDAYLYGPFTASYNVIDPSAITYTITANTKGAVSIVDAEGKVLETLSNGQEFWIKCTKAGKVTSVKVDFAASGRSYDENQKGTIFAANFALNQNVITGLGYINVNGTGTTGELIFNPKTGVPNIAIVFVITLIAFSLGYLALSYNHKAVELK